MIQDIFNVQILLHIILRLLTKDPMRDVKCMKSVTSDVFSDSRIRSNSTNKQKDDGEENDAPLQSGQLIPFLQEH